MDLIVELDEFGLKLVSIGILSDLLSLVDRFSFFGPLGKASIQNLDVLVAHRLEHPCNPVAEKAHGAGVVADDLVLETDVESLHGVNKLLFIGHHHWEVCAEVLEVVKIQKPGSLDVGLGEVESLVIARLSAHGRAAVQDPQVLILKDVCEFVSGDGECVCLHCYRQTRVKLP